MKVILLSLFLFSIFIFGINAQNCTADADCASQTTKRSCCFNPIFATGECYDRTTDVCAACYCNQPGSQCSGDVSLLCSIAEFGPDAECCAGVRQCINPAVNECCSYNARHSSSPQGVICPASDTGACCGANCQDESTQQCCQVITSIVEYYPAPKNRTCCGLFNTCDPATQDCQRITSFPYGQCVTKTTSGSDGTTAEPTDNENIEGQCNNQACCAARANGNAQTGTGFLQYKESCKQGGQDCVGNSGCQLCFNAESGAQNTDGRAVCNFGGECVGDQCGGNGGDNGDNSGSCSAQACCDAIANPNYQTGTGFYQYNESCKSGGLGCVGNTGCQLCFRGAADQNTENRPICPF